MIKITLSPLHQLSSRSRFSEIVILAALNKNAERLVDVTSLTIDLSTQRYSKKLQTTIADLLKDRNFEQQHHTLRWRKHLQQLANC